MTLLHSFSLQQSQRKAQVVVQAALDRADQRLQTNLLSSLVVQALVATSPASEAPKIWISLSGTKHWRQPVDLVCLILVNSVGMGSRIEELGSLMYIQDMACTTLYGTDR